MSGLHVAMAAVSLALLATACGDDGADESSTPRVTTVSDAALEAALLPLGEVSEIGAFRGATTRDLEDVDVFENPDPRGPCGGPSPPIPLDGAVGRAYVTETRTMIQAVIADDDVDEFVEAQLDDVVDPCGPFETETNTGATQRVRDVQVEELESVTGYTASSTIEVGGRSVQAANVLVADGDRMTVLAVSGAFVLTPGELDTLVDLATEALTTST